MRLTTSPTFRGEVVWLTPDQGGRRTGPPDTPLDQDFAATAFVPPATVETGLASFVLRVSDRTAWRSEAEAAWLAPQPDDAFAVTPGSIVIVTEGAKPVAYFHVREVAPDLRLRE